MRGYSKRTARLAILLIALVVVTLPATAEPLDPRVLSAANTFIPDEVTITKGERLEYTNLEPTPHNMIARRLGKDGKPVFRTDTIGAAATVPVVGVEKLAPGVYDFVCTLHPGMVGTVYVNPSG